MAAGSQQKRGHLDPLSAASEVPEFLGLIKPEEFLQETANLDHRIEDMSRAVRFDHLEGSKSEEKARQKRDEARKQKEAELRSARKREQEARNPQRKVALRLENKRRFEQETLEDPSIPMIKVEVPGSHAVSVVDVRMLRSRCRMMGEGTNVRQMLETEKNREKQDRCMSLMRSLRSATSSPEFLSTELPSEQSYEDRRERVKAQQQANHVNNIIQKLANCRNRLPYKLPYRFAVQTSNTPMAPGTPSGQRLTIMAPSSPRPGVEAHVAEVLAERFAQPTGQHNAPDIAEMPLLPRRQTVRQPEVQKLMGELGRNVVKEEAAERKSVFTKRRQSVDHRQRADASKVAAARVRLRKRWAVVRAACKVFMLRALILRRRTAIGLVKNFLAELGEWARMRSSIKRLMSSIKVLQKTCKNYQATKRQRCEVMQRQWERVEDQELTKYFRMYSQRIAREMREQITPASPSQGSKHSPNQSGQTGGRARQNSKLSAGFFSDRRKEFLQMVEFNIENGKLNIDWRAYKIPEKDRWATITCFYTMQLKKHVRSKSSFLAAVKARVDNEKEMIHFLKMFGANETQVREFRNSAVSEVTPPDFWQMSDETVKELIALAAQDLVNEKPFQEHPCNKDLPPDKTARSNSVSSEAGSLATSSTSARERAAARLRRLDLPGRMVSLGRLAKKPEKTRQKEQPEGPEPQEDTARAPSKLSIEDLFNRFTPRLREISDVQAMKSRASRASQGSRASSERQEPDGVEAVAQGVEAAVPAWG